MPRIINFIHRPETPESWVILNSMDRWSAIEEALIGLGHSEADVVRLAELGEEALENALSDCGWVLGSEFDAPYQDERMMSMESRRRAAQR